MTAKKNIDKRSNPHLVLPICCHKCLNSKDRTNSTAFKFWKLENWGLLELEPCFTRRKYLTHPDFVLIRCIDSPCICFDSSSTIIYDCNPTSYGWSSPRGRPRTRLTGLSHYMRLKTWMSAFSEFFLCIKVVSNMVLLLDRFIIMQQKLGSYQAYGHITGNFQIYKTNIWCT